MLPDLAQELQELYTYLQEDDVKCEYAGTAGLEPQVIDSASAAEYIPTVVGTTTELLEPVRDNINRDHIYHKNIDKSPCPAISMMEACDSDFVTGLLSVCSTPAKDIESRSDLQLVTNEDIGSDGNMSPYSDMSSACSPGSESGLHADWNDCPIDLFPQLDGCLSV